jgi:hypothetical protein
MACFLTRSIADANLAHRHEQASRAAAFCCANEARESLPSFSLMIGLEISAAMRALSPLSHFIALVARACKFAYWVTQGNMQGGHIANEIPELNGLDRPRANPALKSIAGSQIGGTLANSGCCRAKGRVNLLSGRGNGFEAHPLYRYPV